MTSQIPFTPVTAGALARLTTGERAAFSVAADYLARDQKPPMGTIVTLVETIQRLIGEPPRELEAIGTGPLAERQRPAAVISPERFRALADWFDADDEFKVTMFPETWPHRASEVQDDLRKFADLLSGGEGEATSS